MTSIIAQQIKLDLELVPKENRLEIGKCNGRIPHGLKPKEETFQVVLDALALTPCYPAFVITADLPERTRSYWVINSLNDVVIDLMHQPWRTFAALINRSLSGKTTSFDKLRIVPPKFARKFKKASPSKKDSVPVPVDEEPVQKGKRVKRSAKKSSTTPTIGIIIKEPFVETQSKRKEKVDVAHGKGIDLLLEVALTEEALTEEAQMKEVRKKSLRDFHKSHPSSSGLVAKKPPSVDKITPPVTSKGTSDKPGVPNVTKEESTKTESEPWGNAKDDSNNEEGNSESDQQDNDYDEVKDVDDDDEDEHDKFEGDEDRGMESDDVQDKKANVGMTDAQQEKENLEITQEQVVKDDHVIITKKTKVPVTIFRFNNIVIALEKDVAELKNDPLHTQVTALVDDHLNTRMGAIREEFMNFLSASLTDRIIEQVINQLPQIFPEDVSNFAPPVIKKMIQASLNQVNLEKASSQPQSTYEAAATITEFELKKILIDKMNLSKSYLTALEHWECYDGLIKSYNLDKYFFSSYDVYSLKRSRDNKDNDEGPFAGSD
nr:hypothetical protein [Tanacetum cinerariifolium]